MLQVQQLDFASNCTTASVTTGEFTLALTDVQTAAMERGRHVYDVVQLLLLLDG